MLYRKKGKGKGKKKREDKKKESRKQKGKKNFLNSKLSLSFFSFSPATSTPSSLFFSEEDAATLGAVRHRRGESTETRVSGFEANSSIVIFSPWGGCAAARRAASEPSARSSGCGEAEAPLEEPWTRPTAGSEQWRAARDLEPARASYHAPPPGKGAVGSSEENDDEKEVEGEIAEAEGDGDATGLADVATCCFFY